MWAVLLVLVVVLLEDADGCGKQHVMACLVVEPLGSWVEQMECLNP